MKQNRIRPKVPKRNTEQRTHPQSSYYRSNKYFTVSNSHFKINGNFLMSAAAVTDIVCLRILIQNVFGIDCLLKDTVK